MAQRITNSKQMFKMLKCYKFEAYFKYNLYKISIFLSIK